jgi:hypothetical protein
MKHMAKSEPRASISEGNVTQTNAALPLYVHTIHPKKDIKLCYGQLEANLTNSNGRQILVPISGAKCEKRGKI